MGPLPRIAVADRSELAKNMYQLLLGPLGGELIVRRRFEEVRPHFFRRPGVALGIFSSNVFGKKFDEIAARMIEDEPLKRAPKIFLCRENPAEEPWRERLQALPNAHVLVRPFHPDELSALVARILASERQRGERR